MTLTRNYAYWWLVGGSFAWVLLVFAAPFAEARGWGFAPYAHSFFRPVCHQNPLRSFLAFGGPLAVCNRCLGLYCGFAFGLLTLPYLHGLRYWLLATPRKILLFFAPMLADVLLWENVPWSRFTTGFVAAFPVALVVWAAAHQLTRKASPGNSVPADLLPAHPVAADPVPNNPVTVPGGER